MIFSGYSNEPSCIAGASNHVIKDIFCLVGDLLINGLTLAITCPQRAGVLGRLWE